MPQQQHQPVRNLLFAAILTVAVAGCGVAAADDEVPTYCQTVRSTEVCIPLQVWLDGEAPAWMYESGSTASRLYREWQEDRRNDPNDEALPPHEGA